MNNYELEIDNQELACPFQSGMTVYPALYRPQNT